MPASVPSVSYKFRSPFMPAVIAVALGAAIAGCSSNKAADENAGTIAWSQPGGSTVAPAGSTTGAAVPSGPPLNWRTHLSGDTVTVELHDANDYYRVQRVDLVGPNGMTIAASEIDRETNRNSGDYGGGYSGGPSVGLGVGSWGGSRGRGTGVGLGLGFPLGGSSSVNEAPPPVVTTTRARIRVPDEAFYRQTADQWVVRVTTTDRSNQSNTAVFPAPKAAN